MITNQQDNKTESNPFFNKVGKPQFSSKDVACQLPLNSKQLDKELEEDAKRKAHNRKQSLQDIKNDVVKNIYKFLLPFILFLLVVWCICCWANSIEIKSGVEWLISTIISVFIGTLIGKFI